VCKHKDTYKTKAATKETRNGKKTHSKDKFLNLNSDPNIDLPVSRVFGVFCRRSSKPKNKKPSDRGRKIEIDTGEEIQRGREKWFSFPLQMFSIWLNTREKTRNSIFKRFISTTFWFSRTFLLCECACVRVCLCVFLCIFHFEYFTHLPFDFLACRFWIFVPHCCNYEIFII